MQYRELDEQEYARRLRTVIFGAEGLHRHAQDVGDGRATIGFGYTFNRGNNVAIWRRSGIELSAGQWQQLADIDRAPNQPLSARTGLGLRFARTLNAQEGDDLFAASLQEYAVPADRLGMPNSDERVAMVSLAYNRGAGAVGGHPVMDAIRADDRAEAWFQMRYNCWGTAEANLEGGLRKRRFAEAHVFGLYDDPDNVTLDEARNVYRMLALHRDEITRVERAFGVTLEGEASRPNRIAQANRDYPDLVAQYGRVPTISEAIAPARAVLLQHLRQEHPELREMLTEQNLDVGRIHLDAGRELRDAREVNRLFPGNARTQTIVRHERLNSTVANVDDDRATTLDARTYRNGVEQSRNDLLIGEAGGDILRGGLGADVMLGGRGHDRYEVDAGDVVKDADGRGTLSWAGRTLDGGTLDVATGRYRSADGALTYARDGERLTITNARGESARVEGFNDGELGIRLSPSPRRGASIEAPGRPVDPRQPTHPDHALYRQTEHAVHALDARLGRAPDDASERMAASLTNLAREHGLQRVDHVVLGQRTEHAAAGQNVFIVQGGLDDAGARVVHMPTQQAVQTPVEQSFRMLEAREQERSMAMAQQVDTPSQQAPVLQRA